MSVSRSASVTEAMFNANASLRRTGRIVVWVRREEMVTLLDYIGDLEFETQRARGTLAINALHESFIRRSE